MTGVVELEHGLWRKTTCLTRRDWERKNGDMDRDHVIASLRANERQLKEAGVLRLSLFGSTARNEAGPNSDVDLLAAFDVSRELSLLDVVGIELQISRLLGVPVDLSEEGTLKPLVRASVEAEAVRAF
jgi:predicted nucleotidyltransferase